MRTQNLKAVAIASCIATTTALFAPSAFAADADANTSAGGVNVGANTTVGGLVYLDFSYVSLENDNSKGVPVETAPNGAGFDVKRLYLIVNHTFNDIWSANLTTDAQYSTASTTTVSTPTSTTSALTSQTTSGGVTEVFIKKLYLQGSFDKAFVLHVGSYDTGWAPWVQDLYGYRFIEKTTTDRLGFANTDDWGAFATGSFGEGDLLSYSVAGVDGGGYKNPTRTKFVDLDSRVALKPVSWLTLGVGFYDGHLGQITAANESYPNRTATRLDGVVAVNVAAFRVGAEYYTARNFKTVNSVTAAVYGTSSIVTSSGAPPVSDQAAGYSAWASYNFTPRWAVFARDDDSHLSEDVARPLTDTYYNFGVSYQILTQLEAALVYKNERVIGGSNSISAGDAGASYTIGGATATGSGTFREYGLYLQYGF